MQVIILAAGQGTRLRPLTEKRPKCLVELSGKSILEHQLDVYKKLGLDNLHIIGGYRAEMLDFPSLTQHQNADFATTNMVSTLFCAEGSISGEEDVIVSYGDIVFEDNILVDLMGCDAEVALAVDQEWFAYWSARMEDPLSDAETLIMDDKNKIVEVGKKPKGYSEIQGQYIGLIKIRADKVKEFISVRQQMSRTASYDGQDYNNMYMTSFIQHLINCNWDVHAVKIKNGWAEVDCAEDLAVATKFWSPLK